MSCPSEDMLLAFSRGELRSPDAVSAHLADCDECRILVAAAVGSSRTVESIGRFRVTGVAGHGAMGIVYRGRDERLGRDVAIKVIRSSVMSGEASRRLEREAMSLARIDHPNVVRVYDIDESDDGEIYLAMELVEGGTLLDWLAEGQNQTDIIEHFVAAGLGLGAVHAAGIVHRDFKAANVLLDARGTVKVADFGLADDGQSIAAPVTDITRLALTQTGMVLGTPAYMAPEQLNGGAVTERSDQFSFCVALFEALAGHRPFEAGNIEELCRALEGQPLEPRRPIPKRIHRALRRGLATRPEDRFATMGALLRALEPRRRRWLLAASVATLAVGATVIGVTLSSSSGDSPSTPCSSAETQWSETWTGERKDRLRAAVVDSWPASPPPTAKPAIKEAWSKLGGVKASLNIDSVRRFGDDWRSRYRLTCEDSSRQTSSEARLRRACLDDVLSRLAAQLDEPSGARFEDAIAETREQLERCATHLVAALSLPPDEVFDAIEAARKRLASAAAARLRGDLSLADEHADAAVATAETTGYLPLAAEAWLEKADIARARGKTDDAISANHKALAAAQSNSYHRIIRRSSDNLAWHHYFGKSDAREARRWLEASERLDGKVPPTSYERVLRMTLEAQLARQSGDIDRATRTMREAVALATESKLSEGTRARASEGLITLLMHALDFDAAERVIATLDSSADGLARLIATRQRGNLASLRGDLVLAATSFEQAAALAREDVSSRARLLIRAGQMRGRLEEYDSARQHFASALALDGSASTAQRVECALAQILAAQKSYDDAIEASKKCLRLRETREGPLLDGTLVAMRSLGGLYRDNKQHELALDTFERALARYVQSGHETIGTQLTRFDIARLLLRRGRAKDRARALELAGVAERAARKSNPEVADVIARWLSSARR